MDNDILGSADIVRLHELALDSVASLAQSVSPDQMG